MLCQSSYTKAHATPFSTSNRASSRLRRLRNNIPCIKWRSTYQVFWIINTSIKSDRREEQVTRETVVRYPHLTTLMRTDYPSYSYSEKHARYTEDETEMEYLW